MIPQGLQRGLPVRGVPVWLWALLALAAALLVLALAGLLAMRHEPQATEVIYDVSL